MENGNIERAAGILSGCRRLVVLTGAGVSAESGVPTFRGAGGLWRQYRAEDLATPEAFARDPKLVWEWYDWRRSVVASCAPNPAHHILARWEKSFDGFLLATQNVDGLHAAAGSRLMVELHGNIWRLRCVREEKTWEDRSVPLPEIPPRCPSCGALARPDIVWFGEALPEEAIGRLSEAVEECGAFLSVGTSAVVYPAAAFAGIAQSHGAAVIEINPEVTPATRRSAVSIRGAAGMVLPQIARLIERPV